MKSLYIYLYCGGCYVLHHFGVNVVNAVKHMYLVHFLTDVTVF